MEDVHVYTCSECKGIFWALYEEDEKLAPFVCSFCKESPHEDREQKTIRVTDTVRICDRDDVGNVISLDARRGNKG